MWRYECIFVYWIVVYRILLPFAFNVTSHRHPNERKKKKKKKWGIISNWANDFGKSHHVSRYCKLIVKVKCTYYVVYLIWRTQWVEWTARPPPIYCTSIEDAICAIWPRINSLNVVYRLLIIENIETPSMAVYSSHVLLRLKWMTSNIYGESFLKLPQKVDSPIKSLI